MKKPDIHESVYIAGSESRAVSEKTIAGADETAPAIREMQKTLFGICRREYLL